MSLIIDYCCVFMAALAAVWLIVSLVRRCINSNEFDHAILNASISRIENAVESLKKPNDTKVPQHLNDLAKDLLRLEDSISEVRDIIENILQDKVGAI